MIAVTFVSVAHAPPTSMLLAVLRRDEEREVKRMYLPAIGLLLCAISARAIIIRHDVPDEKYRVDAKEFPQLADLPGTGQGVLISPYWVVTVARAVEGKDVREVTINGEPRAVTRVVIHPGYKPVHLELEIGDAAPLMLFERNVDDIAMLELKDPVTDVVPVPLYRGSNEQGEVAEILGKGATGNGELGEYPDSPRRGQLRRAYSRVEDADGRWLKLQFHSKREALPLEGMPGDGDEGGPVLIKVHGTWTLAGLISRKYAVGDLSTYMFFRYGNETYETRISHYGPWIDNVMVSDTNEPGATGDTSPDH